MHDTVSILPDCRHWCLRNMNDMWNEEWTEVCRQKFINRMYKFPTNPTYTLNTGAKMPVLGFGTWRNQQVSNVTQRALRRGLRYLPYAHDPLLMQSIVVNVC